MIARALLFAALLPLSALAQLQIFQFDGTNYTPAGPVVNIGTVAPGDKIVARFRVRSLDPGPVVIQNVSLAGDGFAIQSVTPPLPITLSPYAGPSSEAEIDIAFRPTIVASYSATLIINGTSVVLQAGATASATVTLAGSNSALTAGSTIDFGPVAVGSSKTQGFVLSNSSSAAISVASVAVSGTNFTLAPVTLPIHIGPGQSTPVQVTFTPSSGSLRQGLLTIDQRTFKLTGQGLSAPLPKATIVFASTFGASAQQNSVSISLASASQVSGTGTLTMAFQSSVNGIVDDPAIAFASGPHRAATVSISVGDTAAKIGGQTSMTFQTGATAGTITFTLTLGGAVAQQAALTISPSTIVVDSFTAVRELGALDVAFSGFDNTYSASQLVFTFYDLKGLALPQGAITVDASNAFHQYFTNSPAGGTFALLAKFPVTGDTSQVGFVMAQLTNSAGATIAQQIAIGN